ncbi:MAG TPA: 30S ribosome-binding factor RbfA [Burkholderiales bacterium]|nr:30S ribosome-binding factor RbfA [Burkholderiales bacterium]
MPKDFPRSRRIAEQVQRELSDIIRLELKDPRVGMITLTDVEMTQDNAHARVYFTLLGDASRVKEAQAGLQHAAGYLRTELAHRLKIRVVPQLHFEYDASVERGIRLYKLIETAVAEDARRRRRKK